jgi:hypothetical protein
MNWRLLEEEIERGLFITKNPFDTTSIIGTINSRLHFCRFIPNYFSFSRVNRESLASVVSVSSSLSRKDANNRKADLHVPKIRTGLKPRFLPAWYDSRGTHLAPVMSGIRALYSSYSAWDNNGNFLTNPG